MYSTWKSWISPLILPLFLLLEWAIGSSRLPAVSENLIAVFEAGLLEKESLSRIYAEAPEKGPAEIQATKGHVPRPLRGKYEPGPQLGSG